MLMIFDLDGTLLRSHLCIITAVNSTLEKLGLPVVAEETVLKLIGEKDNLFADTVAPGYEDKEHFMELYIQSEHETIRQQASLFDGVREMLEALKSKGHALVLCSNGSMEYINLALEASGIAGCFDMRFSGNDFISKSHAAAHIMSLYPSMDCVITGDRYHDILAAKDNGAVSVAALYGYGKGGELDAADYSAYSPSDVTFIAEKLLKEKS